IFVRARPVSSKLSSDSHRTIAARRSGHSWANTECHAKSTRLPFTRAALRHVPSNLNPNRRAALNEGVFSVLQRHTPLISQGIQRIGRKKKHCLSRSARLLHPRRKPNTSDFN